MEDEYEYLRLLAKHVANDASPRHHANAGYWAAVAEACGILVQSYQLELRYEMDEWKEEKGVVEDIDAGGWWATPEAHRLIDQMQASRYEEIRYRDYMAQLEEGRLPNSPSQAQATFSTSQIGFCGRRAGSKNTKKQQSEFEIRLVGLYNAAIRDPRKRQSIIRIHDSATGRERRKELVTAVRLVPRSLGEDALAAIFGTNAHVEEELDMPSNSIILDVAVERAMRSGAIAIVPDLPDDASAQEIAEWEGTVPKEYKWKVVDAEAKILNECLEPATPDNLSDDMAIRDLHGKRLSFKSDVRPRVRYLFFAFVVTQLQLAWRRKYRQDQSDSNTLGNQLGNGFRALKGHYLERSFLLALTDEIGRHTDFEKNILVEASDDDERDHTGVIGIAKLLQYHWYHFEEENLVSVDGEAK